MEAERGRVFAHVTELLCDGVRIKPYLSASNYFRFNGKGGHFLQGIYLGL